MLTIGAERLSFEVCSWCPDNETDKSQIMNSMRLRGALNAVYVFNGTCWGISLKSAFLTLLFSVYANTHVSDKMFIPGRHRDLSFSWREDPHQMDGSRGHRLQEVHHSQRRVELWNSHVGGGFLWGAALLGHEQPGRESLLFVLVVPVCYSVLTPFAFRTGPFYLSQQVQKGEQSKLIIINHKLAQS